MKADVEVCVETFESVEAAVIGGAHRIELCSALELGGLTPSVALLEMIKRKYPMLSVFCLIRCRTGGFSYTRDELQLMEDEIRILDKKGADGFVIGCLTENSSGSMVVSGVATEILTSASEKPFTFHRAFDVSTGSFEEDIKLIAKSGCDYVLTSGRASITKRPAVAFENIRLLSAICKKWNVKLMIGGGVNEANILDILALNVDFIHGSFSVKESFKNDIFHLGIVHKSDGDLISRIAKLCFSQ